MNNEGMKKEGNGIVGYIVVVLFFVGFFGAIFLGIMGEIPYCIISLGVSVTILGGLFALGERSLRKAYLWLIPIIGMMMMITPLYYLKNVVENPETSITLKRTILIISAIIAFAILGIALCYASIAESIYIKNCCTQVVLAKCSDLERKRINSRRGSGFGYNKPHVYVPTWEYEWNGTLYKYKDCNASNIMIPVVGESYELYINPQKPEEAFVRVSPVRTGQLCMGILCMIAAVVILVLEYV